MASFDVRQKQFQRRRDLIDAMVGGTKVPQGQMVSGHYVAPGILDVLAPAAMQFAGNYAKGKLDEKETGIEKERQAALAQALEGLNQSRQAGGDQFGTFASAAGSEFSEMRDIGQAGIKALLAPQKPRAKQLKSVVGPDGKPRYADFSGDTPELIEGFEPYYKPAASTNVNVTTNLPQGREVSQMAKVLGELGAKRVDKSLATLDSMGSTRDMLQRMEQLESMPVLRGGAAPLGVWAAQAASTFGIPVPESVSNAEQLDAMIQDHIKDFIREGARGFTDEDAKRVEKALPGMTRSAEGARKVRLLLQDAMTRAEKRSQNVLQTYEKRYPELKGITTLAPPVNPAVAGIPGQEAAPAVQLPQQGQEMDGYIFMGGDPADPSSWRKK